MTAKEKFTRLLFLAACLAIGVLTQELIQTRERERELAGIARDCYRTIILKNERIERLKAELESCERFAVEWKGDEANPFSKAFWLEADNSAPDPIPEAANRAQCWRAGEKADSTSDSARRHENCDGRLAFFLRGVSVMRASSAGSTSGSRPAVPFESEPRTNRH